MTKLTALIPLTAVLALGCTPDAEGPMATLNGSISDDSGSQARLAGSGSVEAAAEVEVLAMRGDLAGEVVGTAEVTSGEYSVQVPAEAEGLVVVALDADGAKIGSVIVEVTGDAGSTTVAQPVDGETSLEAEVFLELDGDVGADSVDTIDLRKRVFADLAAEVSAGSEASIDAQIDVIADAVAAAQETRLSVFAEGGSSVSVDDLRDAKVQAMADLVADLDAGESGQATYTGFFEQSLAAEGSLGIDASVASKAEHQASAAFRGVLTAGLEGRSDSEAALDAGIRGSGVIEAHAMEPYMLELSNDAAFDGGASAQLELATENLLTDVRTATNAADTQASFDTFATVVLDPEEGPVAALWVQPLPGLPIVEGLIDAAFDAQVDFAASLESELGSLYADGEADVDVVADTVMDEWAAFESSVQTSVDAAATAVADTELATSVMIEASGAFVVQ